MTTEMGEYLVGAYLKLIEECDFVDYNVRAPGGGLAGLEEIDVVGFQFRDSTAYLCEVTTHIGGLLYKDNRESVARVRKKFERQQEYAGKHLSQFDRHRFMFWSPVVPVGYLTTNLAEIEGLELVINGEYKRRVQLLLGKASREKHDTGNPVFRVFQILGALRD
jgi:hypothetical protein